MAFGVGEISAVNKNFVQGFHSLYEVIIVGLVVDIVFPDTRIDQNSNFCVGLSLDIIYPFQDSESTISNSFRNYICSVFQSIDLIEVIDGLKDVFGLFHVEFVILDFDGGISKICTSIAALDYGFLPAV